MASEFLYPNLCGDDEDGDIPEIEGSLNNQVRQTYFKYLHRMISENGSRIDATPESIMKTTQKIELLAVRRAIYTEQYREQMLDSIKYLQQSNIEETTIPGLCPKMQTVTHSPSKRTPKAAPKDAHRVYNSVCAQMEKMFQEEPEIPSSPEDSTRCPILWNSEYHIQKSLLIQQLNVISKFNPPKYLRLTAKLNRLFNGNFGDESLCGTPESFSEIQNHCKKRITQIIKHFIRPYYIMDYFSDDTFFKIFVRGCVHRLAQASPHIGPRSIMKGISRAFSTKKVQTIGKDTVEWAIGCVVQEITNYDITKNPSQ